MKITLWLGVLVLKTILRKYEIDFPTENAKTYIIKWLSLPKVKMLFKLGDAFNMWYKDLSICDIKILLKFWYWIIILFILQTNQSTWNWICWLDCITTL